MRKVILFIATQIAWTSTALAADPTPPLASESQMPAESSGLGGSGSTPSDLPAPSSRTWVNRPLLITSSVILVGSYVPAAAVAYSSERPADQTNLYYPVVGPWMNLADRQCDVSTCNNEGLNKTLLIASGVGQGLGAIGLVASIFVPGKSTRNWYLIGNDKVHAGPQRMGNQGYGFVANGEF